MKRLLVAWLIATRSLAASAAKCEGPIFDAHLHYNDDATALVAV